MKCPRIVLVIIAILLPSMNQPHVMAQFAWDGDCGTNWYDCCIRGEDFVNNWTITGNPSACPPLPGVTDTVFLSNVVDSGAGVIDVAGMFQSGIFLCNAQTLSILDGDILTSGQPDDPGLFRLNGIINLYDNAIFEIGSFSTLDFQSGQIRYAGARKAKLVVSAMGTLTRSTPNGSFARIDVPIDNQGLVRVTPVGEQMWILGGGVSTGLIDVLPGATLHMQGAMTLDGEVSGGGLVHFGGGTTNIITEDYHPANTLIQYGAGGHTVNFEAANSIENLTLGNSGSLGGAADLSIDDLKWYEGQMLPGGTVSVQDTALFQGTMDLYRDMELHGTSIMPSAWFRMQGAELRNYGDLELQGNTTIDQFCCTANAGIKNFASLRKTGGGITQINVILSNVGESATIEVGSGELRLNGDMATEGHITVSAGATLSMSSGQQSVFPSGSITGQGTVRFDSGFAQVDVVEGFYDIPVTEIWGGTALFQADAQTGNLHLYSGALAGDGILAITDRLHWWNAVFMSGPGTTRVLDEVQMNGNGYLQRKLVLDDLDSMDVCDPCPQGMLNVEASGELRGSGTIQGSVSVYNGGLVSPGGAMQSPGTILNITGTYTQYFGGTLFIDLTDGPVHDQLQVLGNANLGGGPLTVTGNPPAGQSFTILTANSLNGTFGQVNLPRGMTIAYTANSVILQSASSVLCPADIAPGAGDNVVGIADLLAVIGAWGACPTPCTPPSSDTACPADVNDDCVVGIADLLAVIGAWGACD